MMSGMEQEAGKENGFAEGSPPLLVLAAAVAAVMEGRAHRIVSVRESETSWTQAVREELARTEGGSW